MSREKSISSRNNSVKDTSTQPVFENTFKTSEIKDIIQNILTKTLSGKTYNPKEAAVWTQNIANEVGSNLKDLNMDRFKHVVQVVLGQQLGAGAKYIGRCRWDSETDSHTSATYASQSLFCIVTVFGIYLY